MALMNSVVAQEVPPAILHNDCGGAVTTQDSAVLRGTRQSCSCSGDGGPHVRVPLQTNMQSRRSAGCEANPPADLTSDWTEVAHQLQVDLGSASDSQQAVSAWQLHLQQHASAAGCAMTLSMLL